MKYAEVIHKRAADFRKSLSPRQGELVDLMAKGYDNDKLAEELGLKLKTVKNMIRSIYRKMQPTKDEDPRAVAVMLYYVHQSGRK